MDALTIVIMLILFVIAMIFVFSTALLTPYIGKKNLITVVLLGLIVGVVGGAFLLSPIMDDVPDFTRTLVEDSVTGSDVIEMDLSTNGNLTEIIQNISSIHGVQKVEYEGITIKVDGNFDSNNAQSNFETAINNSNDNIVSVEDTGNNTFFVRISEGGDPQAVLNSIYGVFSEGTYTNLRYTAMTANATVEANNVTNIMSAISQNNAMIVNVSGPTEDRTNAINQYMPDKTNVILISGIIGVIVALAGFFIDSIYTFRNNRKRRNSRRETSRDRIKRKTVPGTGQKNNSKNRRRSKNDKVPRKDSIDIFDDSFDQSPKQNIGSNKNFKELSEDDLKTREKTDENKGGRFSGLSNIFRRSSGNNKKSKPRKQEKEEKHNNSSKERKVPRIKPKRRE